MESIGPIVFVSSTFYDLKYIRYSLEEFIKSLGFRAILFDKGDISYDPKRPLESSCYDNINSYDTDIYVLIIGNRYGSKSTFEKESSITKSEFQTAQTKHLPSYILIEKEVFYRYKFYIENKNNHDVEYGVDINILKFIEEIDALPLNNPIQLFEDLDDIRNWLKKQWTGHFRSLLRKELNEYSMDSIAKIQETTERIEKYFETFLSNYAQKNKDSELSKIVSEGKEQKILSDNAKKIECFFRTKLGLFILQYSNLKFQDSDVLITLLNSFKSEKIGDFLEILQVDNANIQDIKRNSDAQMYYEKERKKFLTI